ncbi:dihydropteroate synthase [Pseudomonadota bacterium]
MQLDFSQPRIMGILNITPDSFSDGGRYSKLDMALQRVENMIAEGVDIVDVGGESTRPGALTVGESEEIDRVVPLIEAINSRFDIPVSIDTTKAAVMTASVGAGAAMINDVRALQDDGSVSAAANLSVPVCLMHMQGQPRTMQSEPEYKDVVREVYDFLDARIKEVVGQGVSREALLVDPGFGFGKTLAHNLSLLKSLSVFGKLGLPVLVGVSRKSMFGGILDKPVDQRLYGSLAAATIALMGGAAVLRVHDVAPTVDIVKTYLATNGAK